MVRGFIFSAGGTSRTFIPVFQHRVLLYLGAGGQTPSSSTILISRKLTFGELKQIFDLYQNDYADNGVTPASCH